MLLFLFLNQNLCFLPFNFNITLQKGGQIIILNELLWSLHVWSSDTFIMFLEHLTILLVYLLFNNSISFICNFHICKTTFQIQISWKVWPLYATCSVPRPNVFWSLQFDLTPWELPHDWSKRDGRFFYANCDWSKRWVDVFLNQSPTLLRITASLWSIGVKMVRKAVLIGYLWDCNV